MDIKKIRDLLGNKVDKYSDEELLTISNEILEDLELKKLYDNGLNNDSVITNRPWVVNYNSNAQIILPNNSLYETYKENNKDRLNEKALFTDDINDFYTHEDIIKMSDKCASFYKHLGLDENSRIGMLVNGSIEEVVCLLGANKIGTLTQVIDFTKGPQNIGEVIYNTKPGVLVIDEAMLPMEPFVNNLKVPVIVAGAKNKYNKELNPNYYTLDEVLNIGEKYNVDSYQNVLDKPSIIINSSGTTGMPKPIVQTDRKINLAAQKMLFSNNPFDHNNVMLKTIPAHIGLGLITTTYTSLVSGTKLIFIKGNSPQESIMNTTMFIANYKDFIKKNGLDQNAELLMFAAPMFYRALLNTLQNVEDLSFLKSMLAAGSKMSKDELEMMDNLYKNKGCTVSICNGYGQNELCGGVAINDNKANKFGSAGYPVIGTKIRIVDQDTLMDVKENEIGKILEKSDSSFLYYEGMDEKTKAAFVTLPDGSVWYDTNDLGYMDKDGFIYITGRTSRVIVRFDCKIPIDDIEIKFRNHPAVKECGVIVDKDDHIDDDKPVAFITLNDGYNNYKYEDILKEIQASNNPLGELEVPVYAEIVDELPYLSTGKIDYKKLEERIKKQGKVLKKEL